jgi:hypothetical protein
MALEATTELIAGLRAMPGARIWRAGGDVGRVHVRRRRSFADRRPRWPSAGGSSTSNNPAEPALHRQRGACRRDPEFLAELRGVLDAVRGRSGAQRAYGVRPSSVATHRCHETFYRRATHCHHRRLW